MKPGQSVEILSPDPQRTQTKVAADIGPRPEKFFEFGIGSGRAPAGIPVHITKLENELQPVPGYGRTSPGPAAMTSRGDSDAADYYLGVSGNDERGTMSFGPKPGLENPKPFFDRSSDSGGPITVDGRSMLARKKPDDGEGDSA
jgi:hypothetical protein